MQLINLDAASPEQSAHLITMTRPEFVITENLSRQLEKFAKTGVEARTSKIFSES
jgi:hypothetical protein